MLHSYMSVTYDRYHEIRSQDLPLKASVVRGSNSKNAQTCMQNRYSGEIAHEQREGARRTPSQGSSAVVHAPIAMANVMPFRPKCHDNPTDHFMSCSYSHCCKVIIMLSSPQSRAAGF